MSISSGPLTGRAYDWLTPVPSRATNSQKALWTRPVANTTTPHRAIDDGGDELAGVPVGQRADRDRPQQEQHAEGPADGAHHRVAGAQAGLDVGGEHRQGGDVEPVDEAGAADGHERGGAAGPTARPQRHRPRRPRPAAGRRAGRPARRRRAFLVGGQGASSASTVAARLAASAGRDQSASASVDLHRLVRGARRTRCSAAR